MTSIILLVGLLPLIVIIVFIFAASVKIMMKSAAEDLNQRYPKAGWILKEPVNFFGVESIGMKQVRGNAILILTEKVLVCRLIAPVRWTEIRIETISGIEHPRSFLGKSKGKELLVVNFTNDKGEPDALGFLVKDPQQWATEINRLRGV